MNDCNYAHVMQNIIRDMILFDSDTTWLKSKYLRRGRLVENLATRIAYGNPLAADDPWWKEASGNPNDPDDFLLHEECRDALGGVKQFIDETGFRLMEHQVHLVDRVLKVQGTLDWCGCFPDDVGLYWDVEIKRGKPPTDPILAAAYKYQRAGYKLALAALRGWNVASANLYLYEDTYKWVADSISKELVEWPKVVWSYYFRNRYTKE